MAGARAKLRPTDDPEVVLLAEEEEADTELDDWSSDEEEDEDDQPPTKVRRGEGDNGGISRPTGAAAAAAAAAGASLTPHPDRPDKNSTHLRRSCKQDGQEGRPPPASVAGGAHRSSTTRSSHQKCHVPYELADWDDRELRRFVYRRGDYCSDPRDVAGELTIDDAGPAPSAPPAPSTSGCTNHNSTVSLALNSAGPPGVGGATDHGRVLEFLHAVMKKVDGPAITGSAGTLPEDYCLLSHLVGPDQHRHRQKVVDMVRFTPEVGPQHGSVDDDKHRAQDKSAEERFTYHAARELLHAGLFSLQQRLLMAARTGIFSRNLTLHVTERFLQAVLGALTVFARHRVGRNFILDTNPSRLVLTSDEGPDKVLHTGRPDFTIYMRTEAVDEPEVFCIGEVKKKCPSMDAGTSRSDTKRLARTKRPEEKTTAPKVHWHGAHDHSGRRRLARTTFERCGGALAGHVMLALATNARSCFQKCKYLGMIVHGTKIQLVVLKMKNAGVCVDSLKVGSARPAKKLCCLYTPNMDFLIPEERHKLLEILVTLVL